MIKRQIKNCVGITLVEVLIAAVLLAFTMIPLWGLMGSSHKQAMTSADELRLAQIATEILEQYEAGVLTEELSNKQLQINGFEDNPKHSDYPSYITLFVNTRKDTNIRYVEVYYEDPTTHKKKQYTTAGYAGSN